MLEEQATRVEELLAKLGDTESKQEEDEVRSAWYCYYRCMDVCTSPVGSIQGAFPSFSQGGTGGML